MTCWLYKVVGLGSLLGVARALEAGTSPKFVELHSSGG